MWIACSGLDSRVFTEAAACVTRKRSRVILGREASLPSALLQHRVLCGAEQSVNGPLVYDPHP